MQPPIVDPEHLFRLVHFFDVLAAIVFAVSGSLVASRKGLDVMAFMWFAVITGVGGGTVRDVILGAPVFWVEHPVYVSACLVTAVVMHFVAPLVESRYRGVLWFDAFGLALVTIAGTVKAADVGVSALVAVAMGAVTGVVGGIIRDTLGHVPSVLLGHEILRHRVGAGREHLRRTRRCGRRPCSRDARRLSCDVHRPRPGDQVRLVVASVSRIDEARALEERTQRPRESVTHMIGSDACRS